MAQPLPVLTESDRRLLQEFLNKARRMPLNTAQRPAVGWDISHAPEVYLIKTPSTGIDALTTTDSGVTVTPGVAQCSVYMVVLTAGVPSIQEMGLALDIYNASTRRVVGDTYMLTSRDKAGSWWAIEPGTPTEEEFGTGTGTGDDDNSEDETGTSTAPDIDCVPVSIPQERVECEDGFLNVYSREVNLNIVEGCLTKSVGKWEFARNEGRCGEPGTGGGGVVNITNIVNVTDITQINNPVENVFYFNTYNNTLNILIGNIWYEFCICATETGTGTGTTADYWWCMSPPADLTGTGTPAVVELITDCTFCATGVPDHLTFKIISGCDVLTQSQPMVYSSTGPAGAGWYTTPEDIDGTLIGWFMACQVSISNPSLVSISQLVSEIPVATGTNSLSACSPFDSGEFGLAGVAPCIPPVIVQVVE